MHKKMLISNAKSYNDIPIYGCTKRNGTFKTALFNNDTIMRPHSFIDLY